jgi:hypothetical protein
MGTNPTPVNTEGALAIYSSSESSASGCISILKAPSRKKISDNEINKAETIQQTNNVYDKAKPQPVPWQPSKKASNE